MGFQQGLSGLNASAKNLDVIGHNIANANTTGFKASRTEFAAMIASAEKTAPISLALAPVVSISMRRSASRSG